MEVLNEIQTPRHYSPIARPQKKKELFAYLYLYGIFGGYASLKLNETFSFSYLVFPPLYIVTILYLFKSLRYVKVISTIRLLIIIFTGLTVSSILCYNPVSSIVAISNLIFNSLFAIWASSYYTKEEFLKIILKVLKLMTIVSIILLFIYPDMVIYVDPLERENILGLPNFKGLFPHKIHAGIYSVIGLILSHYFYKTTAKKSYIYLLVLFTLGVLVSGSSLAFSTLLIIIFISPGIKILNILLNNAFGIISFILLLSLVVLVSIYLELPNYILMSLGRDATLTGRTTIWEYGIDYFLKNPITGGGFNVFFDDSSLAPAQPLWNEMQPYQPPSFHNGYIEILAEAGLIGSIPFFVILISTFLRAIKLKDTIFTMVFILCIVANTGAAVLVKPNTFFFVFLIYSYFLLNKRATIKQQVLIKPSV